ncbi:growth arrest-specific protein 2-like [Gigantopelta aegis]|uniref:growth arrest-specific protein 2-like n=1 Tax=Gigantopelta aegis TaxID=1735272 RepID=UPI001B88DE92|nr:growth arrest-specific protein 2-like [Gigantopelta aegis]
MRMSLSLAAGDSTAPCNGSPRDEGEEEGEAYRQQIQQLQDMSLAPLKEDLVNWLAKTLGIDISTDTLMDVLDNGVHLCKLAKIIEVKASECAADGKLTEPLPNCKLKCKMVAKSGSWFARDNSANFLTWCRNWGIIEECLFETEDLVSHKHEKPVIVCLLELARLGYKYGLEPPNIIKMEKEIEQEEKVAEPVTKRPNTAGSKKPEKLNLHAEVQKMARKCHCEEHVKRIREGMYSIFKKTIFIRLLNDKHLMVRVGGGWDTLEHYLLHHNPHQVFVFSHSNSEDNILHNVGGDHFLYIKAKYKS